MLDYRADRSRSVAIQLYPKNRKDARYMSKCVRIVIPGQPVSKLRPRVTRNGHTYTPEKTVRYEKLVQDMWKVYGSESFGDSPIRMEIDLYMKIPKSESKKKKEQMINGLIKHTKKT